MGHLDSTCVCVPGTLRENGHQPHLDEGEDGAAAAVAARALGVAVQVELEKQIF
jgi:hypothetical protein